MSLENIMLSEICQLQQHKYCMFSLICKSYKVDLKVIVEQWLPEAGWVEREGEGMLVGTGVQVCKRNTLSPWPTELSSHKLSDTIGPHIRNICTWEQSMKVSRVSSLSFYGNCKSKASLSTVVQYSATHFKVAVKVVYLLCFCVHLDFFMLYFVYLCQRDIRLTMSDLWMNMTFKHSLKR